MTSSIWIQPNIVAQISPVQRAVLEAYAKWAQERIRSGVRAAEILRDLSMALANHGGPDTLSSWLIAHGWLDERDKKSGTILYELIVATLKVYAPNVSYEDLVKNAPMLAEGLSALGSCSNIEVATVKQGGPCIIYKKNATVVYIPITKTLAQEVFRAVPELEQSLFWAQHYIDQALATEDRDEAHRLLRKALAELQSISNIGQQTIFSKG